MELYVQYIYIVVHVHTMYAIPPCWPVPRLSSVCMQLLQENHRKIFSTGAEVNESMYSHEGESLGTRLTLCSVSQPIAKLASG